MSANKKTTPLVEKLVCASNPMQRENKDDMVSDTTVEDQSDNGAESVKAEAMTSSMANIIPSSGSRVTIPESTSDFKDWLEGIKMVARLPGGMPVEFRRKLWLALAERYLKRRGVDWEIEKVKWFSDKWRADDEELGIQIVKDLHRTGHSLLSGPHGELNQAKLKRILMGYTRWNPEVGYCQGFNMLGAIILQVMDKSEVDSIKVLIFLIEGLLPAGYFCGSLMGLQIDMAVFRELLGKKLPKLARHLQKLQYPNNEPTSVEPPLINVFTMQWFLTLFCNCLPMTSVLRIWDLIMIEGSDVLLRTALSIWKLLEDKILLEVRTADDFYCKMETLMSELSNEHIIDSNVMVQMISDLGPIRDLQKLRQKHLTASYNDQKQLKMMYSKAQGDTERLAVANAWQNNRPRRGSQQLQSDREKIALDITILKKQYDKLRERQKQAHIILTSAVSKQNQQDQQASPKNVNKLLVGKHAIVSKGRKGPPKGAIPPARKVVKTPKTSSPSSHSGVIAVKNNSSVIKEPDTIHWQNTEEAKRRKNSLTWKEINAESSKKTRSDSSSYSENSDSESSTDTSLCDDEKIPSLDSTPVKKKRHKDIKRVVVEENESNSAKSASSESHSSLMATLTPVDEKKSTSDVLSNNIEADEKQPKITDENLELCVPNSEGISSISQLSPMPDISSYFSTAISPIKSPSNYYDFPDFSAFSIASVLTAPEDEGEKFEVSEQGVTNEFFERITSSSAFNKLPSSSRRDNNSFIKFKNVNQKSLSMEEESFDEKNELIKINRSFSDGTIISNNSEDVFQKIIAENSKILTKFSNESLSSSSRTPIVETILEEAKSSEENSSECEEIAAIDIAEAEETSSTIVDGIQDIADIAFESQNSDHSSYIESKPSATMSLLACNAELNDDDDVTLQNEKSMNGKNSEDKTLATLQTTCNALLIFDENESLAQKSLPLKDVKSTSEKVISPKFNEISALVDKLKRDMESELKKDEEENSVEKIAALNRENDVTKKDCAAEVKVNAEIEVKDSLNACKERETVSVKITINCEEDKPIEAKENVENHAVDLENENRKIDGQIESDSKLVKLNAQVKEGQPIESTTTGNEKYKESNDNQDETLPAKDSSKILEKLNAQLQRYEEPIKSPIPHRSPSAERTNDYKKELEALLKEREIEKISKSATYRYDESPKSITVNSSSSLTLYDHEPRNKVRRCDIASLESTQQTRRPFKSSPSSSLSSSPSNIHDTLSSIQNTIKSLDSACQRSEIYNYKKLDKAMESIEKICESDREWHFYKRTKNFESPPLFKIDDISNTKPQRNFKDDLDLSPVRSNFTRFEAENVRKPKTPELDPDYLAKLRCLSTEEYIAGRKSPMGLSPSRERITIDRYSRIDRSPTSPSLSSRFLKSPTGDRASKSAENSPSRYGGESTLSSRYARYSPSGSCTYSSDFKAESMNNLSYKVTEKKNYEFEWEKASSRRRYEK